MLNQYNVKVYLEGRYYIEDPCCPSEWRGSGVYDKEITTWCDLDVEVWAHSLAEAVKFADDYEYEDRDSCIEIYLIDIESARRVKARPDRDDDEVGVIEHTIVYNWKEYGPQV